MTIQSMIIFGRILQVVVLLLFSAVGWSHLLDPLEERPSWDWEGYELIGWKARVAGAVILVFMLVVLGITEHFIYKAIKPKTWEFSTSSEKIEMLHNDMEILKNKESTDE